MTVPLPQDLLFAQEIYSSCNFICKNFQIQKENQKYGGYRFEINNRIVCFRLGKITPTKKGLFVAFWRRNNFNKPVPYDIADGFDFLIIHTRTSTKCGQFVFPFTTLHEKGFLSKEEKGGKNAIRVYPPWEKDLNKTAQKTQKWQLHYFFEISPLLSENDLIRRLF